MDIKEFAFLEKIFLKTQPEERTWVKLVSLKTIHWYCDGPEPTPAAVKYEEQIRRRKSVILFLISYVFYLVTNIPVHFSEMDDAKRRALIRSKAAKKTGDVAPPVTGPSNPSIKRKTQPKGDRQAKKAKVSLEPVVGLMAKPSKTTTPIKHGVGKGLMKGP